jgi:glucose/arabinose dehydrogenase
VIVSLVVLVKCGFKPCISACESFQQPQPLSHPPGMPPPPQRQDPTSDAFDGRADYSAVVGYFQWPQMDTYHVVIDNLPCATSFHSIASLSFDNAGLLYAGVGSVTNAGTPAHHPAAPF